MYEEQIHLDIETLDVETPAKILSIGAICGTEEFYCEIDQLLYPEAMHFTTDQDTIDWWERQGGFQPTCVGVSPSMAMSSFSVWFTRVCHDVVPIEEPEVWANPPKFDCNKINYHLKMFGMAPLWGWWQERCVRTEKKMALRMKLGVKDFNNPHHALKDAKNQQAYIASVYETLADHIQRSKEQNYGS